MTPDVVEAIRAPYDPHFLVWSKDGTSYQQGDKVGPVGLASTYAVRLHGPRDAAPRFLWVQDGVFTNPMAHQPIASSAVFDAWGRYLGRGGSPLSEPGAGPVNGAPAVIPADLPSPPTRPVPPLESESPLAGDPEREEVSFSHTFRLREDFLVTIDLPQDLTSHEAERIATWVRALPIVDRL